MTGCMVVLLLLCFYTANGLKKAAYTQKEFPDPRKNFQKCGQVKRLYICDPSQRLNGWEGMYLNWDYRSASEVLGKL